ncbi:MAG TPA: DNA-processing protein DprA [Ktedonobacterales bacterium]|jgi:DNA processing protein
MPETEPPARQPSLPGAEAEREDEAAPTDGLPTRAGGLSAEELACWVAFTRVRGIGPKRFGDLLSFFGSAAAAWRAGRADLLAARLDARATEALLAQRAKGPAPEAELEALARRGIRAVSQADPDYPELLREIYLPPILLYVRGTLAPEDAWAVAMVGTRKATSYGFQVAEHLARGLASNKVTVISGLARGIDTAAHKAALAATDGRTIAVLGCGLDVIYPPENAKLAARICEQGALVSEFPLGTQPEPTNFPIRNRVISGLSLGVVVVEAPRSSGALITTRFALDQNRQVFAVPGHIYSKASEGTNALIQAGAKLVMSVKDILEELKLQQAPQQEMRALLPATGVEGALLALLAAAPEPLHIDELCRASSMPAAEVTSALLLMQLKGMVQDVGNATYAQAR